MNVDRGSFSRRTFCAASAGLAAFGFNRLAVAGDAETGKTISLLARFKLNMEKEAEAIQTLKELCAAVEKNEPGALVYLCSRVAKKPDEIVFFEVYKDEEAFKAHSKAPHLAKLRKGFVTALFRPPLELTRLDRVGGFAR
jgi:quinol monooxygenase YgiN